MRWEGAAIRILLAGVFAVLIFWVIKPHTPMHIEKKAQAVVKTANKAKPAKPVVAKVKAPIGVTPTTHIGLMAAAGIQPKDYGAADYIISHESNWNPDATEPNTFAHGLPQALPYSKTGCGWEDAVCQLKWASTYAVERYGGWQGAYAQWISNRWW